MSTKIERAPVATPAERATPRPDLDTQGERGQPHSARTQRWLSIEMIGLAAAIVATIIMYVILIVHPVAHESLAAFLAKFARGNAAIWPMQLVWYAIAVAIVGLALWPRRRASQLACLLAAAYLAWVGIACYGVLFSGVNLAWLFAAVFTLEGILFLVTGLVRRDPVFAPRWDLASVLGALFMCFALVGYPLIGLLSGIPLRSLPVIGFAPCPTTIFALGLLLWVRKPSPLYLLPIPLAFALGTAAGAMATGIVPDFALILAGAITAGVLIWRDRTSSLQTVVAGVVLAVMIAFTGHDDWLMVIGLILVAVTLAQAIWGDARRLHASRPPQSERALTT